MQSIDTATIVKAIKATGTPIPTVIQKLQEKQDRIREATREFYDTTDNGTLAAVWAGAILEDRNPYEDPEMIRAIITHTLRSADLERAGAAHMGDLITEALTDAQDDILDAFKNAVAEASNTLTSAHDIIGDYDDDAVLIRLGTDAVAAHHAKKAAINVVRLIDHGWSALARQTRFAAETTESVIRLADLPVERFEEIRRNRTVNPWEIITRGGTLDLAIDRATVTARTSRHAEEREQQMNERTQPARRASIVPTADTFATI